MNYPDITSLCILFNLPVSWCFWGFSPKLLQNFETCKCDNCKYRVVLKTECKLSHIGKKYFDAKTRDIKLKIRMTRSCPIWLSTFILQIFLWSMIDQKFLISCYQNSASDRTTALGDYQRMNAAFHLSLHHTAQC